MSTIPKDPVILLSYVDEMCQALDADKSRIISVLSGIGYQYEPAQNSFR